MASTKKTKKTLKKVILEDINSHSGARNSTTPYSYDLVHSWIKRARTSIQDCTQWNISQKSKEILLRDALECLDLLDAAFEDSVNRLSDITFNIREKR